MSMVTSCPACTTTFRVSQEQLKQRNGRVRCGRCRGVFDAFKSLATLPDEPALEPAPDERTPATAPVSSAQGSLDIGAHMGMAAGQPPYAGRVAPPAARGARNRAGWPIAAALLALALAVQVAYVLRDPLAAALPGVRPALERLCAFAGCTIALPKRSEQLALDASDLQADPARPNVIVLTAVLRNRGSSSVAHPALELTLTNAQDQAIARRIFLPSDYLPHAEDARRGMDALGTIDVRIELDTGDLRPAGYRLFLFYP